MATCLLAHPPLVAGCGGATMATDPGGLVEASARCLDLALEPEVGARGGGALRPADGTPAEAWTLLAERPLDLSTAPADDTLTPAAACVVACDATHWPSCQRLAVTWLAQADGAREAGLDQVVPLEDGDGPTGVAEAEAVAEALLDAACLAGWGPACVTFGRRLVGKAPRLEDTLDRAERPRGGVRLRPEDAASVLAAQAVPYFERGCVAGDARGCVALGDLLVAFAEGDTSEAADRALTTAGQAWAAACPVPASPPRADETTPIAAAVWRRPGVRAACERLGRPVPPVPEGLGAGAATAGLGGREATPPSAAGVAPGSGGADEPVEASDTDQ